MNDQPLLENPVQATEGGLATRDSAQTAPSRVLPQLDAKQLRVEQVGRLLDAAYQGASTLKLTREEEKKLMEEFPDEAIEIRREGNLELCYISHMELRERLWSVFGPGHVAEICRERMLRTDTQEMAVDLVLLIRGKVVAEAIGTSKYYPNNARASFGDTIESAWSDALRRCCKRFGCGTQVWRPAWIRAFMDRHATLRQNKREEKLVMERKPQRKAPKVDPDWPDAPTMTNPPEDDIPF